MNFPLETTSKKSETKKKQAKIVTFNFEEFTAMDFIPPAKFYIMDSMQNYVFIRTRSRAIAQETVDEIYGRGKYRIKAASIGDS